MELPFWYDFYPKLLILGRLASLTLELLKQTRFWLDWAWFWPHHYSKVTIRSHVIEKNLFHSPLFVFLPFSSLGSSRLQMRLGSSQLQMRLESRAVFCCFGRFLISYVQPAPDLASPVGATSTIVHRPSKEQKYVKAWNKNMWAMEATCLLKNTSLPEYVKLGSGSRV